MKIFCKKSHCEKREGAEKRKSGDLPDFNINKIIAFGGRA